MGKVRMPTKHHTYPHQPNGRQEERLALDGALQKGVNYPVHTTPTGEVALGTEVGVYKLIRWFIEHLNRQTFQLRCVCYNKKKKIACKVDNHN